MPLVRRAPSPLARVLQRSACSGSQCLGAPWGVPPPLQTVRVGCGLQEPGAVPAGAHCTPCVGSAARAGLTGLCGAGHGGVQAPPLLPISGRPAHRAWDQYARTWARKPCRAGPGARQAHSAVKRSAAAPSAVEHSRRLSRLRCRPVRAQRAQRRPCRATWTSSPQTPSARAAPCAARLRALACLVWQPPGEATGASAPQRPRELRGAWVTTHHSASQPSSAAGSAPHSPVMWPSAVLCAGAAEAACYAAM